MQTTKSGAPDAWVSFFRRCADLAEQARAGEAEQSGNEAPAGETGADTTGEPGGTPEPFYQNRRRPATTGDPLLDAVREARRRATEGDGRRVTEK